MSGPSGEEVAIKVLESIHEMIEEIEEEYQVLRDLSEHPNMPRFYGMFLKQNNSYGDQIWLVMEVRYTCVLKGWEVVSINAIVSINSVFLDSQKSHFAEYITIT